MTKEIWWDDIKKKYVMSDVLIKRFEKAREKHIKNQNLFQRAKRYDTHNLLSQ